MKISVSTDNVLVTIRTSNRYKDPFLRSIFRNMPKPGWKPTHRRHETSAYDTTNKSGYLLNVTHTVTWRGLTVKATRRYPITPERAAQWSSQSHLESSTRLAHPS